MSSLPRLTRFQITQYKAFGDETEIRLAPITLIFGRNNSGKSALCRAPLFFSHCLKPDAWAPFPLELDGIDFGTSLLEICFRRFLGMEAKLEFSLPNGSVVFHIGGFDDEQTRQQRISQLYVECGGIPILHRGPSSWQEARTSLQQALDSIPLLRQVPGSFQLLLGVRARPEREYRFHGSEPHWVGNSGALAPLLLSQSHTNGDAILLDGVNNWFQTHMHVGIELELRNRSFSVLVRREGGTVNLVDTGEGLGQVLPLVVALKSLSTLRVQPTLVALEQPELHLHPYAHPALAELLIEARNQPGAPTLLVETHSDTLILRLRRAVAEGRLDPDDVLLYYVADAHSDNRNGSKVTPIQLNDRGTPGWWPKGVFAEDQEEFAAIRRALLERDRAAGE